MKKVKKLESDKEMIRKLFLNKHQPKTVWMPFHLVMARMLIIVGLFILILLPKIDKKFEFNVHSSPLNKTK